MSSLPGDLDLGHLITAARIRSRRCNRPAGLPEGTVTRGLDSGFAAVDVTGRFLYVLNRDSKTVSGFYINRPTGALTPMSPATFATGDGPVAILTAGAIR